MPITDKKIHSYHTTVAQRDAIDNAIERTGDNKSALIRSWWRAYCEQHGVAWPDDMPARGTYERETNLEN